MVNEIRVTKKICTPDSPSSIAWLNNFKMVEYAPSITEVLRWSLIRDDFLVFSAVACSGIR